MNLHKYILVLFIGLLPISALATHNRAGEITYSYVSDYTYEITVTTYTVSASSINRCELTVEYSDGTSSTFYRVNGTNGTCPAPAKSGVDIGNDVQVNIYKGTHTFPSAGYYTISVEDLNRNANITNIQGSVQVPFYVSTTLLVNPAIGPNNSPQLLNPPIDRACINQLFVHNPGAFDADGDSLSYELVNCKGLNGRELTETYSASLVQDPVIIDPITGDFIWNVPQNSGEFNFAFVIKEYRRGRNGNYQLIGSVTRDMQVNIEICSNQPPVITPVGPFCVEAGSNLNFTVTATDPDGDNLALSATGGPFEVTSAATFPNPATGASPLSAAFNWTPSCDEVRMQPYYAYFRAEDAHTPPPNLVDIQTVEIRVVAPSPKNPLATPNQDQIDLVWDPSFCQQANGYDVYRRRGSFGFTPANCETGVPEYTGYEYIGSSVGWATSNYVDSVDVEMGVQYCYMVVATFDDGSESYASVEFCTELSKTLPIITNVDVSNTDPINGSVELAWVPALDLDSNSFPPPYRYIIERAPGIDGSNFTQIADLPDTDLTYSDVGINTEAQGWNYRIQLLSGAAQNYVGTSGSASSIYASTTSLDESIRITFESYTPWDNDTIIVYRETSPGSGIFDSIGLTTSDSYRDTGLVNGDTYCYYGMGIGRFTGSGLPAPLFNRSQVVCGEPDDSEAPCQPTMSYTAICEDPYLRLDWSNPAGCPTDVLYYNIYYRASPDLPWPSSPIVSNITATSFEFTEGSIVGCYAVTAVDDAANPNESDIIESFCIEGCAQINLPDVFSPNGDGVNDFFFPIRDSNGDPIFRDISTFSIEVYNRWGRVVYATEDVDDFVNKGWDGTDRTTNLPCAEGVYFYICRYNAQTLGVSPEEVLKGSIHLYR